MNTRFKLIIGLGNTEKQYTNTYHNVGFLMIDYLTHQKQLVAKLSKNIGFMNTAGASIRDIIKQTPATLEQLLIIHDDSDIALGEYKLSQNRNAAGHKGVENIIQTLGTNAFWRLRIGIRPKTRLGTQHIKAGLFVLKKITVIHKKILLSVFKNAATLLETHS